MDVDIESSLRGDTKYRLGNLVKHPEIATLFLVARNDGKMEPLRQRLAGMTDYNNLS